MCLLPDKPKPPPPMKPLPAAPAAPPPPAAPAPAPAPLQAKETTKTVFKAGDSRSSGERKKKNASALRVPLNLGGSSGGLNI